MTENFNLPDGVTDADVSGDHPVCPDCGEPMIAGVCHPCARESLYDDAE